MKKTITFIFLLLVGVSFGQVSFGDVSGKVIDLKTKDPIWGARVFIEDAGQVYNSRTETDGSFKISAVPSGTYLIQVLHEGDTLKTDYLEVRAEAIADAGVIPFSSNVQLLGEFVFKANDGSVKIIKGFLPLPTMKAEEISKSPIKFDINSLVSSMTTDVKMTDDGSLVFRGARKGDMIYYVDGMKVVGELNVPSAAISNMMVYSGGLPAQFGDTMGGVVAIESKGYFELLRNYKSAQLKKGN